MFEPKYIVWKSSMGFDEFVIFPSTIKHDHMADDLGILITNQIISAGFVNKRFECFGESISLNVKSRGEIDTSLIRNHFQIGK